jgi:hypothetical protein
MPENRAGTGHRRLDFQAASAGFCGLRQGIDHHGKTIVLPFRLTE